MKIVFFGSDDFAAAHLQKLIDSTYEVVGAVTQPDRAKGRGMKVVSSPVKELATKNNIFLLQPENVKASIFVDELKKLNADFFVVVAYGQILSQEILDIPNRFCINIHGSLLPRYRGAAPINWAIINGDEKTGVSAIEMNAQMDAGAVLGQKELMIAPEIDSEQLRAEMMKVGSILLIETLDAIDRDCYEMIVQEKEHITYAPKLDKNLGFIRWGSSAQEIHNRVRGLKPWPGTFTFITGRRLKIIETEIVELQKFSGPGEIVEVRSDGFVVGTGEGGVLVKKVQMESSKLMSARDFLSGYQLPEGFRLG